MLINDIHTHVVPQNVSALYNGRTINETIELMDMYSIQKSVVMLNPLVESLSCTKGHYIKTLNTDEIVKIVCTKCDKILYKGTTDPFRALNIQIIEESKCYNGRIYPFVYLSLSPNTIQEEIKYFQNNYAHQYYGYKIHPSISMQQLGSIDGLSTELPIIIHTKNDNYSNPAEAFEFAKKYKGYVILAHLCDLNIDILKSIKSFDNILVDMSPFVDICERIHNNTNDLYAPESFRTMKNADIFYELVRIVGADKIVFGSDAPWCNLEKEMFFIKTIMGNEKECNKIFVENFRKILINV